MTMFLDSEFRSLLVGKTSDWKRKNKVVFENINTYIKKMESKDSRRTEMANGHVDYGFSIRIADLPVSAGRQLIL
jgi:hypothetical protein